MFKCIERWYCLRRASKISRIIIRVKSATLCDYSPSVLVLHQQFHLHRFITLENNILVIRFEDVKVLGDV